MARKRKLDIDITLHDVFRRINEEEQRNLMEIAQEEERLGQDQPAGQTPQHRPPRARREPADEAKPDKTKTRNVKKDQSSSRS